jgi:hypothetical protein
VFFFTSNIEVRSNDSSCFTSDQNLNQGSNFSLIFKVLRMRRKQCHCIYLVFLIPTIYLLSQTESVLRRYRDLFTKPNRQKFDADCTCSYSPYGLTWQGRRDHTVVTWQMLIGRLLASCMLTRVLGWLIIGHVAHSKGATCHSLVG